MLNSFCGFRLNTAGVLIGWIGGAFSLMSIVLLALSLGYLDKLTKEVFEIIKDPNISQETIRNVLLALLCLYITFNSINVLSSVLLVAGTVKERHLLLVPWLLNSGLALLLLTLLSGILFPIAIIGLVFKFYIWYAIYSLYKHIQANSDIQQRLIPATYSSYLYIN